MSTTDPSVSTDDAPETDQDVPAAGGRVRWKRFAGMLTVTGALAAGMVALTAQGVLASQFSISGLPFTVTSDKLEGTGFEQFAALDEMIENSPNEGDTGGQVVVVVSAVDTAKLSNLCQSVFLGGKYLKITAGSPNNPVTAKTLIVDSDVVSGDTTFNKINIGQDSSTLNAVPGVTGGEGVFGQQADSVEILNLRQHNYATTAATFKLPHLRMAFTDDDC